MTGTPRNELGDHAPFRSERPDIPDPPRRQPGDTLSGFIDLGEEFTIPRKLRTDTIMATASYPSRLPMWDRKRKGSDRTGLLAGIVRASTTPLCGGWRACRTAATNIKFSGRSGCSPTSAVHTLCRVWQVRKGDRAAQKPKKAAAGFRCLTPPLYGIHADCGLSDAPFTTCAAGPAWQKPRPARPQNGEASRLI
jgi:hypothetical protein